MDRIRNTVFRIFVVSLLLVATTGMPLSWHLCSMSGSVTVSSDCDMHGTHSTTCCDSGTLDDRAVLSRTACCVELDKTTQLTDQYTAATYIPQVVSIPSVAIAIPVPALEPSSFSGIDPSESPPQSQPPAWILTGSFRS